MKTKDKPTLDELVRSNSKVNPGLVASTIAAINEIRKSGFTDEGYRLSGRRNQLIEKKIIGAVATPCRAVTGSISHI
jgi:hypothetical protein